MRIAEDLGVEHDVVLYIKEPLDAATLREIIGKLEDPPTDLVRRDSKFKKLELTDDKAISSEAYAHYLHHKYFEVNYGGEGLIPLDKWFGTWHDGTKKGDAAMQARFEQKKARLNAGK